MKKTMLFLLAGLAFMGCSKQQVKEEKTSVAYFYRLGVEDLDGNTSVTQIVSVRMLKTISGEILSDGNPGTGNGGNGQGQDNHYEGDGCNDNTPRFCEKHPWHKKCNIDILPLKLDYFGVQVVNNQAVVSWRPLIEENIDRYLIQRSEDGRSFKNIGIVEPKGALTIYKYID